MALSTLCFRCSFYLCSSIEPNKVVKAVEQRKIFRKALNDRWSTPWAITFDLRERETEWTSENQARLVKLFAAEKLDIDILEAEQRAAQLCLLVPKLGDRILAGSRLQKMKPGLLAALLQDPSIVASRLATLRTALPEMDISEFAFLAPHVLLKDADAIVSELEGVAKILDISFEDAQKVVNMHPRFLDTELVQEVLDELNRLLPKQALSSQSAAQTLIASPSWLLRVERGPKRLGPHPDDN